VVLFLPSQAGRMRSLRPIDLNSTSGLPVAREESVFCFGGAPLVADLQFVPGVFIFGVAGRWPDFDG
jgi:hypothetical protein